MILGVVVDGRQHASISKCMRELLRRSDPARGPHAQLVSRFVNAAREHAKRRRARPRTGVVRTRWPVLSGPTLANFVRAHRIFVSINES